MFLYVHTTDPHSPYDPSPENEAPFAFDYRGDRDTRALLRLGQLGQLKAEGLRFLIARFQGEVRQTDQGFGMFLDGLKSRGLMDDCVDSRGERATEGPRLRPVTRPRTGLHRGCDPEP